MRAVIVAIVVLVIVIALIGGCRIRAAEHRLDNLEMDRAQNAQTLAELKALTERLDAQKARQDRQDERQQHLADEFAKIANVLVPSLQRIEQAVSR